MESGRKWSKHNHKCFLPLVSGYIRYIILIYLHIYIVSFLLAEPNITEEGPCLLQICCLHPQLRGHGWDFVSLRFKIRILNWKLFKWFVLDICSDFLEIQFSSSSAKYGTCWNSLLKRFLESHAGIVSWRKLHSYKSKLLSFLKLFYKEINNNVYVIRIFAV